MQLVLRYNLNTAGAKYYVIVSHSTEQEKALLQLKIFINSQKLSFIVTVG